MTTATVFVDDAVLGRLPAVCVKDGVPTADRLTLTQDVSDTTGLGVAWLLILAGPLGWLGLVVISALRQRNGSMLTVVLPFSEAAHRRVLTTIRSRRLALTALIVAAVAALWAVTRHTTNGRLLATALAVVALGALVQMVVASVRLGRQTVRLSLDASRRWVTLWGVHPIFAAALQVDQGQASITSP